MEDTLQVIGLNMAAQLNADGTPSLYVLPLPKYFDPHIDDAGVVHAWLSQQGVEVESVSVGKENLFVESTTDPADVLSTYESTPPRKEVLKNHLADLDLDDSEQLKQAVGILTQLVTELEGHGDF